MKKTNCSLLLGAFVRRISNETGIILRLDSAAMLNEKVEILEILQFPEAF